MSIKINMNVVMPYRDLIRFSVYENTPYSIPSVIRKKNTPATAMEIRFLPTWSTSSPMDGFTTYQEAVGVVLHQQHTSTLHMHVRTTTYFEMNVSNSVTSYRTVQAWSLLTRAM